MIQISALKIIILFSLILRHWPRAVKPISGVLEITPIQVILHQIKPTRVMVTTPSN